LRNVFMYIIKPLIFWPFFATFFHFWESGEKWQKRIGYNPLMFTLFLATF
jgi:hypothetical protein